MGHGLVNWFEQMMEFGDVSDEEAPPPNPKKEKCQNMHGCR